MKMFILSLSLCAFSVSSFACDNTAFQTADGVSISYAQGISGSGISYNIAGDYMTASVSGGSMNPDVNFQPMVRFQTAQGYDVCSVRLKTTRVSMVMKKYNDRENLNLRSIIETCMMKIHSGKASSFSITGKAGATSKIYSVVAYSTTQKDITVSVNLNDPNIGSVSCN